MDAERDDGSKVMLKRVDLETEELDIGLYVSSNPPSDDHRNCCVPILDVILIPACETHAIVVMPLLYEHVRLPFRRIGELLEMGVQLSKVGCVYIVYQLCDVNVCNSASSFYMTTTLLIGTIATQTSDDKLTPRHLLGTFATIT